jgi:hypothetical protein
MPLQKPANSQGTFAKGTIGLLLVGVVAAAMVVAARRPANTSNESADMQMTTMEQPQAMPTATAPATPTVSVSAKKPAAAAGKTAATKPSSPKMTVMVGQSATAEKPKASNENATIITAQATDPELTAPQESAKIAAPVASPVTISGCLARDGAGFALKDTAGANAPKSRSWKKGFLKKGSADIELLDSANRLKFKDHVGHRVSVTGILNEREMQARSMQRVSGVCD